nr:hypothetical protein [Sedimentibacter sp.]
MDIEVFFKKVYTIAFRLVGEEKLAGEMATHAIERTLEMLKENEHVNSNMFKITVIEVCKIFLYESHIFVGDDAKYYLNKFKEREIKLNQVQEAILALGPLNRVIIIWRDMLGYKLAEIIPAVNRSEKEMHHELANARRQLKNQLDMVGVLC